MLLSLTATSFHAAWSSSSLETIWPARVTQQTKDIELPVGDCHRLPGGTQATSGRIKLEGFEDEDRAGRHW